MNAYIISKLAADRCPTKLVCAVLMLFAGCEQSVTKTEPPVLRITPPSATQSSATSPDVALSLPTLDSPVHFRSIGAESGFSFQRFDDISVQRRIAEVNGGGVGIIDFDHDGREDIFMTNGCRRPFEASDEATPGKLFRNSGDMQFREVSHESTIRQYGFKHGCAVGDWDADGFDDLYLTAFGNNEFWRNNGDGTFAQVAAEMGVSAPEWSSSAAFADLNQDGFLDLYVVNYLLESDEHPTLCPNASSPDGYEGCSPAILDGVTDRLFVSTGTWKPDDLTQSSGLIEYAGKGLGVVIVDLDDDQHPEIYVANDGQENHLFVVQQKSSGSSGDLSALRLQETAFAANVALNETGYAQAGMGVTAADYDRNGTTDLFLTHFYGDTNTLYGNRGGLFFEDLTRQSGLGPPSRSSLGFGTSFIDVDNDGWQDLLVANGHVDNREWMPGGEPYRMWPQCFHNAGDGSLTDISKACGEYFSKRWLGRGLAVADLDTDGRTDFVVSHQLDQSLILRNETESASKSVDMRLIGTSGNRNSIGAKVTVRNATSTSAPTQQLTLVGGGSFQSASSQRLSFGIGDREAVGFEIRWPSGRIEALTELTPGRWVVVEGRGSAVADF